MKMTALAVQCDCQEKVQTAAPRVKCCGDAPAGDVHHSLGRQTLTP